MMKDKNTKQRKQMIKRMAKKVNYEDLIVNQRDYPNIDKILEDAIKIKQYRTKPFESDKELNFLQAFIILVITLVLFTVIFPLIQRAVDIQSLETCETRGDCSEVIRDINK